MVARYGQDCARATTRERVQLAIGEPGCSPGGAARSPSRRRKEVIGFICVECPGQPLDVENTNLIYPDEVLRGVERRISGLGWSVLVTFWNGEAGQDLSQIAALPGQVDGILISIGSFPSRLVERMARRVPVAVIAGDPAEREVDVVAANDQMAIGVLRSLTAAGIGVPEQVAVVGFDDIFPGDLCEPPLTTVHQPMRLLGERACDRLLERIEAPGLPPRVELLPTELVLRQSCGCPPGTLVRRPVGRGNPATAEPPSAG